MLSQLSLSLWHFFMLLFWTLNWFHIGILLLLLHMFWSLFLFVFLSLFLKSVSLHSPVGVLSIDSYVEGQLFNIYWWELKF